MAPSLDGPIILDGETTREQIVEVYADRELATGCLLLFALLKALFVIFLVINLVSQSRYSFEPAIIVLVVLSLSFFEIRRKSFGKPNAKRAIENLPAIVGSVHGQIDELAVDLTLGENRIHYGWMPGLRLGVRPAGLTIGLLVLPAHLFGDRWPTAKIAFEAADQRLKLSEKNANYIGSPIQQPPEPQTDSEISFRGFVTYDQFSLAQGALWFSVGVAGWVIRIAILAAIVAFFISNLSTEFWLTQTVAVGAMLIATSRLFAGILIWIFGRWWIYTSVSGLVREQGLILAGPSMYLEAAWDNLTLIQSNADMIRLQPRCFGRDWFITGRMFARREQWQAARNHILGKLASE